MYTGVTETTGAIQSVDRSDGGCELRISLPAEELTTGDSIGLSGVCVTAEEVGEGWFEASLSGETVARTYLADCQPGDVVNIERLVAADGLLDGHVVKGTVDGAIEDREADWRFSFAVPDGYEQYVVEKGAVALDGISLTVTEVDDSEGTFSVAVVPATYDRTTLATTAVGDSVHFEADILAKYVDRQRTLASGDSESRDDSDRSDGVRA
jgi:riboflavin synthase